LPATLPTGTDSYAAAVIDVPRDRFEELVGDALDDLPDELAARMDNVVVLVEDDPPRAGLLGLYEGVPLTHRDDYGAATMGGMVMPDRITVYRRPICAVAGTEQDVVDEVWVTVVHEVAHHFGIDDEELEELGWA
jgi:predicted Zn-dependent protease with MMP-like domain